MRVQLAPPVLSGALLLLACSGGGQPDADPAQALALWPTEPDEIMAVCAEQAFEELAITCHVQAAAAYGQRGDVPGTERACALVPEGTWREECHFRAGEELGRAGRTVEALSHCARAGWFGRNCLTHTAWRLPRDPDLSPRSEAEVVRQAGEELLSQVDQVLAGAGDGLEGEGRDLVMARFGYNLYVGAGRADPGPARLVGALGATLRTGFAIEAARLLPEPGVEQIVRVYRGELPVPEGEPLAEYERMGRYTVPIQSPHEQGEAHVPVYGGGLRLVGRTPDEDAVVAALEAMFWLEETPAEAFVPWLDAPAPAVRRTAARLVRLAQPETFDMESFLTELAGSHEDEGVRWHASDGLEHRTWERGSGPLQGDPRDDGSGKPPPRPEGADPRSPPER